MNTANKSNNQAPNSYGPNQKPDIIQSVETMSTKHIYKTYKNIDFYMDTIVLKKSFKFAAVTGVDHPNFQNISTYHDQYKNSMLDRHLPYTEVGFTGNITGSWDYLFGGQVDSLDHLPEGLTGVDTGIKAFSYITFRAKTSFELVGGDDGAGDAMNTASEYLQNIWLPDHMDIVYPVHDGHMCFQIQIGDKKYDMCNIEVYQVDIESQPEMCFYIPLKE